MRNRLQSSEDLEQWVTLSESELKGIKATGGLFRLQITPYYASLMEPEDPECPVRRQVVPTMEELEDDFDIHSLDPLEEQAHSPVKNLVHNYRDRVAFCVVNRCASYCRYCLRKRRSGCGFTGDYSRCRFRHAEFVEFTKPLPDAIEKFAVSCRNEHCSGHLIPELCVGLVGNRLVALRTERVAGVSSGEIAHRMVVEAFDYLAHDRPALFS